MTEVRRLVITRLAAIDLDEIYLFSLERWGDEQAVTYETALRHSMRLLLETPLLGRPRIGSSIADLRTLVVKRHTIWYTVFGESITVLRIAHGRQLVHLT